MGAKGTKATLPTVGSAFAIPLDGGRYGVCRVIRSQKGGQNSAGDVDSVLVACSSWIGDEIPDVSEPRLRPILLLTHHAWRGSPEIFWAADAIPDDFIAIGRIKPTWREKWRKCSSYSSWESARIQPLAQWRWDNDLDAVLSEDKDKTAEDLRRRNHIEQERKEFLANISLELVREHQFFSNWADYPSKETIDASRQIMKDTVEHLIDLGPGAGEPKRIAVLRRCIERFNQIDAEMDQFIETVEREDICTEFETVAHACGLGASTDLFDQWRKW